MTDDYAPCWCGHPFMAHDDHAPACHWCDIYAWEHEFEEREP